jgi:hypothetical protein
MVHGYTDLTSRQIMDSAVNMSRWSARKSMDFMKEALSRCSSIYDLEYWDKCAIRINNTIDSISRQRYYNSEYIADYWDFDPSYKYNNKPEERLTLNF